jgi:serine/threonine-protein kinase
VQAPAVPSSPTVTLKAPPAATTLAPPPANPSADVAAAVAAYARAIESRDIGAVRRAYPGMSDEQQRGFEQFFAAARSLKVSFEVSGVDVSGPTAEANLVGAYDYVADGKTEHQPVSFRAALRRDAGGTWRLMSVR